MVNRQKEMEFVKECISKRRSLILLGTKGIGKTYMLRLIEANFRACYIDSLSIKNILTKIATALKIQFKRSMRYMASEELLEAIIPVLKKTRRPILLDNSENISKPVVRILEQLNEFTTIIAAAEKKPLMLRFREELELKPLDRAAAKEFASKVLQLKDNFVLDLVATKSLGVPGKILEICRDFSIAIDNFEIDLLDRNSITKFFLGVKPQIPERINIFPVWTLFVIGFGLLAAKYIFYSNSDWNTGYMIAATGYMILIIYRTMSERRRKY